MIPPKSKSQAKRVRDQLCFECERLIDERTTLRKAVEDIQDKKADHLGCSCHPRNTASTIDLAIEYLINRRLEQLEIEIDILEKDIELCTDFLAKK